MAEGWWRVSDDYSYQMESGVIAHAPVRGSLLEFQIHCAGARLGFPTFGGPAQFSIAALALITAIFAQPGGVKVPRVDSHIARPTKKVLPSDRLPFQSCLATCSIHQSALPVSEERHKTPQGRSGFSCTQESSETCPDAPIIMSSVVSCTTMLRAIASLCLCSVARKVPACSGKNRHWKTDIVSGHRALGGYQTSQQTAYDSGT